MQKQTFPTFILVIELCLQKLAWIEMTVNNAHSCIFLNLNKVYHCNINSVGRICHNIFDRNYNAQITMRDILNAVYGLLIIPEPEDPLDRLDPRIHLLFSI